MSAVRALVGLFSIGMSAVLLTASAPSTPLMDPWLWSPGFLSSSSPDSRSSRDTVRVFLLGAPEEAGLRGLGVRTLGRTGRVRTAELPRAALHRLGSVPGLEGVVLAKPMRFFMDAAIDSIHARNLRTLEPGGAWTGHTGHGVLIGIVDSGLDATHEDFRFPDGSTRLLSYWDQHDTTGTPPVYGYGSAWSQEEILTTSRAWDPVGHGTHVAGIAAGDGSASQVDSLRYRFAGVAPEAEIVAVAVDLTFDTNILDAVRYVFDEADRTGRAAVVNLSLGTQFGPHDGRTPLEDGLDALAGPGRILVASAGNEGEDRIHAELHIAPGGSDSASVFVGPYGAGTGVYFFAVDAFHAALHAYEVTVVTPGGARFGPFAPEDAMVDTLTGEGTLYFDQAPYPPDPTKTEIALLIGNHDPNAIDSPRPLAVPPPANGEWRLVFKDRAGAAGGAEIDLWVSLSSIRDVGGNEPYWLLGHDAGEEIAAPGSARGVLTVGSMNTKPCWPDSTGQIRCTTVNPIELTEPGRITFFSSRGPTQDAREKPEVVAPGFVVASARSAQITPEYAQLYRLDRTVQPDREHFVYTGTSLSAPQVTGAVALALAKEPGIDPSGLRSLLANSAANDEHAPAPWSPASGYGKLDVAAFLAGFVPVGPGALQVRTSSAGHPRLEWEGGDAAAFRLESVDSRGGWEERARFPGPGRHTWDEPRAGDHWIYRLWSTSRTGATAIWAEAEWSSVTLRFIEAPAPNPFRESCGVTFQRSAALHSARLSVFDLTGRLLRRIEAGAGETMILWDGRDSTGRPVPAGVYWMRAQMGPYTRAARIVRLPA